MGKDFVLSPESKELSDEQSDERYFLEDISDTDFSDVEELDVNDERSETSFAGGVKASRNDMLGAWGFMELKTGGLDQKFCNGAQLADETQMCTSECTVGPLENWTSSGGIDWRLVSETQKGQNDREADDRSDFAQLAKALKEWVQSQLTESQLCGCVLIKPTNEHQGKRAGIDRTGKIDQKSMATVLNSWVHDNQQPRSLKRLHRDFLRLQSCCWRTNC